MREAIRELRPAAWCGLVVGALGPSMCRLAGEAADAVLLSSVAPTHAARSAEIVRAAADAAGRPRPASTPALADGLAAWRGVVDEVVVAPALPPGRPDAVLRLLQTVRSAWQLSA